jgi:hypothetical protein
MHLPQELADYIIDFFHDDSRTLIQASLVSRAWVGRARSHLCESLKITLPKLFSLDLSHLPPLCGYVKALHFTWPGAAIDSSAVLGCFEQSGPHTLALHSRELSDLDEQTIRRSFAKFPCASITTLELYEVSPIHKKLLVFLSLFPNIDDLTISVIRRWTDSWEDDDDEVDHHISPPRLRGSFKFFDPPGRGHWGFHRGAILRTLATLPLRFQTVSLDGEEQSGEEISTFLNSCSKTVRKVFVGSFYRKPRPRIPSNPHAHCANVSLVGRPTDLPHLSDFANLEELRIRIRGADEPLPQHAHSILPLVTSSCLRRVTLEVREQEIGAVQWPSLDENLANLVKRHKSCGNLALQISTKADPEKVRSLLPQATKTGILEVGFSERPDPWV